MWRVVVRVRRSLQGQIKLAGNGVDMRTFKQLKVLALFLRKTLGLRGRTSLAAATTKST